MGDVDFYGEVTKKDSATKSSQIKLIHSSFVNAHNFTLSTEQRDH